MHFLEWKCMISLKFVHKGSISDIPALVQIMAWCRLGDKPLSEPMLACSPTHVYVSRPQWLNSSGICQIWVWFKRFESHFCKIRLISNWTTHYNDVIMSTVVSQVTILTIVFSTVYSGADQRKHQSSASLAFVRGIHRSPVNFPQKRPVTWKMFPFDDVIMLSSRALLIPHPDDIIQNGPQDPMILWHLGLTIAYFTCTFLNVNNVAMSIPCSRILLKLNNLKIDYSK